MESSTAPRGGAGGDAVANLGKTKPFAAEKISKRPIKTNTKVAGSEGLEPPTLRFEA